MMKSQLAILLCALAWTLVAGDARASSNLLANPGFESGLSGWTTFGPGWRTGTGGDARTGTYGAVDDVLTTQSSTDNWRGVYQQLPAKPYQEFAASAWIRTVSLKTSQSFLEIQFLDKNGAVIQQYDSPTITHDQGYMLQQYGTLVAPPGAASIGIRGIVHMLSVPTAGPEFHTFDDFDLHTIVPHSGDDPYFHQLASDTWRWINVSVDPVHGLPYDNSYHGEYTSTSNIGLYLTSVVAAYDLGIISSTTATKKLNLAIRSIKQLKTYHGFQATWNSVNTLQPEIDSSQHVVSLLDAGNLLAGLITVGQAFPQFQADCNSLVSAADINFFYDPSKGLLYGGYDIQSGQFVSGWYVGSLAADSQTVSFLGIAENVPMASWTNLDRSTTMSHRVTFYQPGWTGGGLFMQYIGALWLAEHGTALGQSADNFAFDQIAHKCDIYYPVFGWSACDSPNNGYTNTYGMQPLDYVIAPYACVMAIDDYEPAVYANLHALETLGARDTADKYGFYDGYDYKAKQHANNFLMIDQSFILISLANYLDGSDIRNYFSKSALVQNGYSRLSDL